MKFPTKRENRRKLILTSYEYNPFLRVFRYICILLNVSVTPFNVCEPLLNVWEGGQIQKNLFFFFSFCGIIDYWGLKFRELLVVTSLGLNCSIYIYASNNMRKINVIQKTVCESLENTLTLLYVEKYIFKRHKISIINISCSFWGFNGRTAPR